MGAGMQEGLSSVLHSWEPGWLVGKSARFMIEKLRVWIPAGVAGEFSSPELILCADSYSASIPPPLFPQWHVKDSGHSATSAGGRLHINTHTPMTQPSRSGLTMLLSRHSVGTYQETSQHTTCQGHSATVISARWATVVDWSLQQQKKVHVEMNGWTFPKRPCNKEKATAITHYHHQSCIRARIWPTVSEHN